MSNHISVKFFGFIYSPITTERFVKSLPQLIEELRRYFPRHKIPTLQGFQVEFSEEGIASKQVEEVQRELHMVDAQGLWGVKIGNSGVSFSTAEYISYTDAVVFIEKIVRIISERLGIYHFASVSLRNINLFNLLPGEDNQFEDIKDKAYWGRQELETLQADYFCNGASTRHEYISADWQTTIQLASGVVTDGQSHIPREEWELWKLRGGVPVQKDGKTELLVDINGARFEAPINDPKQQNNVSEYTWEAIKKSFDELHEVVNSVYSDITKE